MSTISIARRKFGQLLGAGSRQARVSSASPPQHIATTGDVVRLSANKNPYGPSAKGLKAIADCLGLACRYPDEHNYVLIDLRLSRT